LKKQFAEPISDQISPDKVSNMSPGYQRMLEEEKKSMTYEDRDSNIIQNARYQ